MDNAQRVQQARDLVRENYGVDFELNYQRELMLHALVTAEGPVLEAWETLAAYFSRVRILEDGEKTWTCLSCGTACTQAPYYSVDLDQRAGSMRRLFRCDCGHVTRCGRWEVQEDCDDKAQADELRKHLMDVRVDEWRNVTWTCSGEGRHRTTMTLDAPAYVNTVQRFYRDEWVLKCPTCGVSDTYDAVPTLPAKPAGVLTCSAEIDEVVKRRLREAFACGNHARHVTMVSPSVSYVPFIDALKKADKELTAACGIPHRLLAQEAVGDYSYGDVMMGRWEDLHRFGRGAGAPDVRCVPMPCGRGYALMRRETYPWRAYAGRDMVFTSTTGAVETVVGDSFETQGEALTAYADDLTKTRNAQSHSCETQADARGREARGSATT